MPLGEIRGQLQALAQLRRALSSQRVHHAYLFAGPAGVGKSEGAILFAQALLCRTDPEGCGSCASCDRIARSIHPDVFRLARDAASGGREIKVESLRELCSALQLRSVEGHRKVALLFEADALTIAAQNALLKTLEEPPPNTTLILITSRELKLLPTIRSRCLRIRFGPLPEDLLAEQLQQQKKLTPEEARLVARLASGSRSQAEGIGPKRLRERSLAIEKWAELMRARGQSAGISAALALAESFGDDREHALDCLSDLLSISRDLLWQQCGAPSSLWFNRDQLELLTELSDLSTPIETLRALETLRETQQALEGNGAPRLQLEAAALRLGRAA